MSKPADKYTVAGISLYDIRNRNELRVIKCMRDTLETLGNPQVPAQLLQDVYAYALNQLQARYTQSGTIVLRDPVRSDTIEDVVSASLTHVLENPKQ